MNRQEISRANRFYNELLEGQPDTMFKESDRDYVIQLLIDYKFWVEPTDCDMPAIVQFIEDNNLRSTSRKREIVYMRAYMYKYIKVVHKLSFTAIGHMFGKDHATIMHNIRTHDDLTKTKDKIYNETVLTLKNRFRL
tara:strand:+ start:366 stop:776 length:411 start_codon:yes stop_codon:yes gene_type:complete